MMFGALSRRYLAKSEDLAFLNSYTKHDISHVDGMLKQLEWVIPDATKQRMSDADWFLTVLSIYFHDLGLLITKDEFEHRNESDFRVFCEQKLYGGDGGQDYRAKLEELREDDRERLLYQEFVRYHHGRRVRCWVENKLEAEPGYAKPAIVEIDSLLKNLNPYVRRDIGMLCESHNLDDLEDFKKYRIDKPYGNSDAETANLHYAAILLRTVDLLAITNERAPTTLFRLINPTDPISQREWAKQNAVTRVKAKLGLGKDGVPDPNAAQTLYKWTLPSLMRKVSSA